MDRNFIAKYEALTADEAFNNPFAAKLAEAQRVMIHEGLAALFNPHGMIGMSCGCNNCFTCAAYQVVAEYSPRTINEYIDNYLTACEL